MSFKISPGVYVSDTDERYDLGLSEGDWVYHLKEQKIYERAADMSCNEVYSDFNADKYHYLMPVLVQLIRSSGYQKPEYICALSRGGLIAGVELSYALNIPFVPIMHNTEDGLGENSEWALNILKNEHILLVDDIIDSGESIREIQALRSQPALVAALVHNRESGVNCDFVGIGIERSKQPDWIYFWWDPKRD